MIEKTKKFTVISLFSGAGGIDAGLHQTGRFRLLAAVEFNKNACETLRANRKILDHCKVIQADLSEYDPMELLKELNLKPGDVDLIVGGPPCQSYSRAGKREGVNSLKGQLIYDYLRFIKAINPRMFLFENVKGILDHTIDDSIRYVIEDFAKKAIKTGYEVQGWLLNGVNYGAPQSRERVILIGNCIGAAVQTPKMTHCPSQVAEKSGCLPWKTLRDAIGDLGDQSPEFTPYKPDEKLVFRLIESGGSWKSLPKDHPVRMKEEDKTYVKRTSWRRLNWDTPCPTIMTSVDGSWHSYCHPSEIRPLSVREVSRVQGFPSDWVFCGGKSEKYLQIGNAVPSPLAAAVGLVIADALDNPPKKKSRGKWKGIFCVGWTRKGILRSTLAGRSVPGGGEPLTDAERSELKVLERQIEKSLSLYMKCGEALLKIKEGKLYRETQATFEEYCNAEFGIDRSRAYQLIAAVLCTQNVYNLSTSEERPVNESQVRALRTLKNPKDQAKAWEGAVNLARLAGSKKVTGEFVEDAVRELLGKGAKRFPDEEYPFSLGGYLVKFTGDEESSPTSVKNAFFCAANDMMDLLEQNKDAVDVDDLKDIMELVDSISNIECERLSKVEPRARIAPLKRGN